MSCRISELVLNCKDPELLAKFWCDVLGYVELDRDEGSIEIGPSDAGFGGLQPTIILSPQQQPADGPPAAPYRCKSRGPGPSC
jgi:hypothetical protein